MHIIIIIMLISSACVDFDEFLVLSTHSVHTGIAQSTKPSGLLSMYII